MTAFRDPTARRLALKAVRLARAALERYEVGDELTRESRSLAAEAYAIEEGRAPGPDQRPRRVLPDLRH